MRRTVEETAQTDTAARFGAVRRRTLKLCEPLTAEDMMVQSCPEASPAKWHLAHTAWFFESFVLREYLAGYKVFHKDFEWLFNSYYQGFSAIPEKKLRASFSRPGLADVMAYRAHVDEAMQRLLNRLLEHEADAEAVRRIELGLNHEEQHQELLLTDILNAFFTDPLRPAYLERSIGDRSPSSPMSQNRDMGHPAGNGGTREPENDGAANSVLSHPWRDTTAPRMGRPGSIRPDSIRLSSIDVSRANSEPGFHGYEGGLREVGYGGEGFCFDNEQPRHRVWLEPYRLATRLVTCGEYAAFMADGGYERPELWLSAGWDAVTSKGWRAPLYWTKENGEEDGGAWNVFTLRGTMALDALVDTPVGQVSFYEADAYARWAGRRLPTEFEWEAAAEGAPADGNLLDSGRLMPAPASCNESVQDRNGEGRNGEDRNGELVQDRNGAKHGENGARRRQFYGDCWEWTASAYLGYPGFKALKGTLGEYNGKFMSGQMVLRGGSCVTPARHIRASYRNFFAPETRWQFSGIRLAS